MRTYRTGTILFFIFGLLLIKPVCSARDTEGYIITANTDTIYGQIKIYRYNSTNQSFIINGIETESFYSGITFREFGKKRFVRYEPEDINGFAFIYESTEYVFHKFDLEYKSIVRMDKHRCRFLYLLYAGELSLYRNSLQNTNPSYLTNDFRYNNDFYDYYLYTYSTGLVKMELTLENRTVAQLLTNLNVDPDFLKTINTKASLKDIIEILTAYDNWLRLKQTSILKS